MNEYMTQLITFKDILTAGQTRKQLRASVNDNLTNNKLLPVLTASALHVQAVALCQGVTNPESSGIGGGGFILIRTSNGTYEVIDAREQAPGYATQGMYMCAYLLLTRSINLVLCHVPCTAGHTGFFLQTRLLLLRAFTSLMCVLHKSQNIQLLLSLVELVMCAFPPKHLQCCGRAA